VAGLKLDLQAHDVVILMGLPPNTPFWSWRSPRPKELRV